jgi:dihydroflavonol-4-reductase
MRILVTGADGMLGSNLVRLLLEREHEVGVLIHPSSRSVTLEGLKITKHSGDILKPESLTSVVEGYDAVVHAAASTSIWPARSEVVRKINIDGTRNMIDTVLKCNTRLMVYIGSGISVNTSELPYRLDELQGKKYRLDYIDSKYVALNMVLDAVKERGLPALAILPTFMIGPYDSLPGSGKIIQTLAQGKIKFYTNGGKNFIHVKDVATAIANSLEFGTIGSFYVAGNVNLTYREFFRKVALIVSKPEARIYLPDWLFKLIGLSGDIPGCKVIMHQAICFK